MNKADPERKQGEGFNLWPFGRKEEPKTPLDSIVEEHCYGYYGLHKELVSAQDANPDAPLYVRVRILCRNQLLVEAIKAIEVLFHNAVQWCQWCPVVPSGAQWCPVVPSGAQWVSSGAQWCPVVPSGAHSCPVYWASVGGGGGPSVPAAVLSLPRRDPTCLEKLGVSVSLSVCNLCIDDEEVDMRKRVSAALNADRRSRDRGGATVTVREGTGHIPTMRANRVRERGIFPPNRPIMRGNGAYSQRARRRPLQTITLTHEHVNTRILRLREVEAWSQLNNGRPEQHFYRAKHRARLFARAIRRRICELPDASNVSYEDGGAYEGGWVNSQQEGFGRRTYPNGDWCASDPSEPRRSDRT
eukprot:1196130-Prorocentrum_minimum.AAC.2